MRKLLISSAILATFAAPVFASPIAGLVNTGAGLTTGQQDTAYTFQNMGGTATGTACGSAMCGSVSNASSFPVSWPYSRLPGAQWLSPNVSATGNALTEDPSSYGHYKWTLDFNIAANPSTASFAATWLTDNYGYVELNGSTIASSVTPSPYGYVTGTNFSAHSGFVYGMNTLTFVVTNVANDSGFNPTGIDVAFTSSNVAATPLPAAALLFGSALIGGGVFARKRKSGGSAAA
jgi:hypothetical protein